MMTFQHDILACDVTY